MPDCRVLRVPQQRSGDNFALDAVRARPRRLVSALSPSKTRQLQSSSNANNFSLNELAAHRELART